MEILRMRADGKGWGQIADAKGFKLGEVKRAERSRARGPGRAPEQAGKTREAGAPGTPRAPRKAAQAEVTACADK